MMSKAPWLGLLAVVALGGCASTGQGGLATMMPQGGEVAPPLGFASLCTAHADLCGGQAASAADDTAAKVDLAAVATAIPDAMTSALTPTAFATGPSFFEAALQEAQTPSPLSIAPDESVAPDEAAATDGPAVRPFDERMALLNTVNRRVNTLVRQTDDRETLGDPDQWAPAVKTGFGLAGDCKNIAVEKRQRLLGLGFPAQDLFYAVVYRRDIGLHAVLVAHTERGDYVLDSRSPWITGWAQSPYVFVKRQSATNPDRWVRVLAPETLQMAQNGSTPFLLAQNDTTLLP